MIERVVKWLLVSNKTHESLFGYVINVIVNYYQGNVVSFEVVLQTEFRIATTM